MAPVSIYLLIGQSNMMGPPLHYFTEPTRQRYVAFRLIARLLRRKRHARYRRGREGVRPRHRRTR